MPSTRGPGRGASPAGLLARGSAPASTFPECPPVVHRGGLAAYSCGGSRGFAQARTAFPWPTTGDYRGWAHERNAAGAVTAHDAIAPHSKNNSAKAESIEFLRNLVGEAPSVRVRRMRARRAPPASQAASGDQPVEAAARRAVGAQAQSGALRIRQGGSRVQRDHIYDRPRPAWRRASPADRRHSGARL